MKKTIPFILLFTMAVSALQAKTIAEVLKKKNNFVLIKMVSMIGKKGDMITIHRETTSGLQEIGTVKIVQTRGKQAVAKITHLNPGKYIRIGDVVTDGTGAPVSSYTPAEQNRSYSSSYDNNDTALSKLLAIARNVPEETPVAEGTTALEKLWLGQNYIEE